MRVTDLYVYPVKACGGVRVDAAVVGDRGFAHDRRWMVIDAERQFLTQRETPRLALVHTDIGDGAYQLTAPGQPVLELPTELATGDVVEAVVWQYAGPAVRHAAGSEWFSRFLGHEASLVYMPGSTRRPVNPAQSKPGDIVSFADAYPFLVISEASLEELNRRAPAPLEMRRFRPNIVVSGCSPHEEDSWTYVRISDVCFRGVKRCDRCAVTTVDPETGERGTEPLRTLATYRREHGKVWFGMNLIHDSSGTLRVGDPVERITDLAS